MPSTAYKSSEVDSGGEKWYYMSGGKKCGPVTASGLTAMLSSGELPHNTRVWSSGMDNWVSASNTPLVELANDPGHSSIVGTLHIEDEPKPKRKFPWWIPVIVLLLAAGVAAWFFLFRDKAPEAAPEAETEPAPVYNLEQTTVFENEECAFIVDTIGEKGDYLELDVRCVNKTDEMLSFSWDSTSINGSMFDPLWNVTVQANSTMVSSITFPLGTMNDYHLLPAEQIEYVLRVFRQGYYNEKLLESEKHIMAYAHALGDPGYTDYRRIRDYDGYLFDKYVRVDKNNRPYYVNEDKEKVFFDELYDRNGVQIYPVEERHPAYDNFYSDDFGRPYYFSQDADTVYYDGYGYGFYDEENDKHYFYDEAGRFANYQNNGIPEYYEGEVSQELLDAGKPEDLTAADECYIVHKEFALYPTGKTAEEVVRPNRVMADGETVYWSGEKGSYIVLGGESDECQGYIVRTYLENDSDGYACFQWRNVVMNGFNANPESVTVLRPHSSAYQDVIFPVDMLKENKIEEVNQINFRVNARGENLSVPLYPIEWMAVEMGDLKVAE